MLAAVAGRMRAGDICARLDELLGPFAGQWVTHAGVPWGAVAHYRSMLSRGRGEEVAAETLLREAIESYDAEGERPWRAHAAAELAQLLAGRGDSSEARSWATEAAEAADAMDLASVRGRAARVLERLGGREA